MLILAWSQAAIFKILLDSDEAKLGKSLGCITSIAGVQSDNRHFQSDTSLKMVPFFVGKQQNEASVFHFQS